MRGAMKVIACIEDPVVIKKILTYLLDKSPVSQTRPVAQEPGAATGLFVRLTLGKAIT